MRITLCASIDFTLKIKEVADSLRGRNHQVTIPYNAQRILDGEISFGDYLERKRLEGDSFFRESVDKDLIKSYFETIRNSDAILVVNQEKNGMNWYIGGNTFLEMGFAYVLNKKIFLLNEIPQIGYTDEIKYMNPIVLNGDLSKIE